MEQERKLEKFKKWLCEQGYEDSVVFENPSYIDAVVGVGEDGAIIYDYDKMAESLMSEEGYDFEDLSECYDFIDYNTVRVLPYINEGVKPVILHGFDEELL